MVTRMPQAFDRLTTFGYHRTLFLCLLPVVISAAWLQGWPVLVNVALGVATAWGSDEGLRRWRKVSEPQDGTAPLWGLLLSLLLPAQAPWYLPVLGSLFAILVVKGLLGGGSVPWLNPVLAAWAFLQAGWPSLFAVGLDPVGVQRSAFDLSVTEWFNNNLFSWVSIQLPGGYLDLMTGGGHSPAAIVAESGPLVLLMATVLLLGKGYLPWRVPGFFFLGFALPLVLLGGDVLHQVFSGSFLLCLFFLATDPSSRPLGRTTLALYAGLAGLFAFLLRTWGVSVDGVGYAVLLMNLMVPWADQWLKRKSLTDFRWA